MQACLGHQPSLCSVQINDFFFLNTGIKELNLKAHVCMPSCMLCFNGIPVTQPGCSGKNHIHSITFQLLEYMLDIRATARTHLA